VPWDENFSDDELIMVPFLSLILLDKLSPVTAVDMDQIRDALYHVWQLVAPGRSSLWSAIALFGDSTTNPRMSDDDRARALDDMLWNLRTWPLDQVNWNVSNSQRQDIMYNPDIDRGAASHDQSYLRVLPCNERSQQRWNSNPWEVQDGGDGMMEVDPGAWVLPYWLAKWSGLLTPA